MAWRCAWLSASYCGVSIISPESLTCSENTIGASCNTMFGTRQRHSRPDQFEQARFLYAGARSLPGVWEI